MCGGLDCAGWKPASTRRSSRSSRCVLAGRRAFTDTVGHAVTDSEPGHHAATHPQPDSSTNKTRVQLSRGETFKLDVRLSEPHHVRIDICTMLRGEKVATMGEGEFGTGTASFEWNGHNDSNSLVATDIYLALIYIDGKLTEKKKFALQR
jgi:hypothetical protein